MYKIDKLKNKYVEKPWKRDYEERIGWLKTAKKMGRHTVAYLYPEFEITTFRYRGFNTTEALEYSIDWTGAYFQDDDIELLCDEIVYADILIMCRYAWNPKLQKLVDICKKRNIKVGYDIDDLIYHPKHMMFLIDSLSLDEKLDWNPWYGLSERNRMALELGDFTITTNEFLAKYLREDYPEKKCFIVKNYLNWIQEDVSKRLLDEKLKRESTDAFVIGYFSGTPTHVKDLTAIMPEIEMFMKEHKDVLLRIVGYMVLPQEYQYLIEEERIEFVPFQTIDGLQYQQAMVDINVVPLINNEFSNCKSELKYFENAIVGTLTCATPTYAYREAIRNDENGYLCKPGEWLPKFEMIYKNRKDKKYQKKISEMALEKYSSKRQLNMMEATLEEIMKGAKGMNISEEKEITHDEKEYHLNSDSLIKELEKSRILQKAELTKKFEDRIEELVQKGKCLENENMSLKEKMENLVNEKNKQNKVIWDLLIKTRLEQEANRKKSRAEKKHEVKKIKELLGKGLEYWKPVFDAKYYKKENEDVVMALGDDPMRLLQHYLEFGLYEGRQGNSSFELVTYFNDNYDLIESFGMNFEKYVIHYIDSVYGENRICK